MVIIIITTIPIMEVYLNIFSGVSFHTLVSLHGSLENSAAILTSPGLTWPLQIELTVFQIVYSNLVGSCV